jgi:hypothetical protein
MRRHEGHAGVQDACCRAVCNLATNAENHKTIARAGGIEALIATMRRHEEHEGVQEGACSALFSFAENAENHKKIACAGGIEAVIAAMRRHEWNTCVQEAGCTALFMFAGDSAVMNKLRGSLTFLQKAYNRHKSESAKRLIDRLKL